MLILIIAIALAASIIGAICGVGGGVVIKPVMDATGLFTVSEIGFLSSCTVLTMSLYSVTRDLVKDRSSIRLQTTLPLGLGAVAGGIAGQTLFKLFLQHSSRPDIVGGVQSVLLLIMCLALIPYTLRKERIRTLQVRNVFACVLAGLCLGMISSFLGIGGGPINLAVLGYLFSMDVKTAARNSLFIILLSQAASLIRTVCFGTPPAVKPLYLVLMVICGLCGGIAGKAISRRIRSAVVDRLFILLLAMISGLCIYNAVNYFF